MGTGGFVFLHSPGFYVAVVEVVGNHRVTAEEIVARSGLLVGSHLLAALDDGIARAILENPWLETVRVRPVYPGRVVITVEEREPAALLATRDGFWVVDTRGFLLAQESSPGGELMVVTGVPEGGWATRQRPPAAELVRALQVVSALAERGLDPQPQEVGVNQGEIDLFLAGGIRVFLGSPGAGLGHVLDLLAGVLVDLKGDLAEVLYIDLRFDRPVIRKR